MSSDNNDFHFANFINDPFLIPQNISSNLLNKLVELGPCQPLPIQLKENKFPTKVDSAGKHRWFHESYYFSQLSSNHPPVK